MRKSFSTTSIILTVLLLLTQASLFILLISFFMYLVIIMLGKEKPSRKEMEVTLFLFFLALWFNLLLYKKAFFTHGINFIWQNIPAPLLSASFQDISFIGVIYAVGVIPLLLGVYAVYHLIFKTKNRDATLYLSFALVSFIMLWLKLISFRTGLLFLSINLIILSAYALKIIFISLSKTKIPSSASISIVLIVLFFILSTLTPFVSLIQKQTPLPQDIKALEWIRNNTEEDSVVLGSVKEGYLINYIAERKNVIDSNFMLINNINQRYKDINSLFTVRLTSEAIQLINKYDIDYLLLSNRSMREYGVNDFFYADNECFEKIYNHEALVYKFLGCEVK